MTHQVLLPLLIVAFLLPACKDANTVNKSQNTSLAACVDSSEVEKEIHVKGGRFTMGSAIGYAEERPEISASVESFFIDKFEVTNAQFREFVETTGYLTQAERGLSEKQIPGLPKESQIPGSLVFEKPDTGKDVASLSWWKFTAGASWRAPYGMQDPRRAIASQPVVHVTLNDAVAYAEWKGRRLPTEAEWEFAATSGNFDLEDIDARGNHWQGIFPYIDSKDDGYGTVSPVGCYTPNSIGAHDMIGNVWELTLSTYKPSHAENERRSSQIPLQVIKGGSYLCARNFCARYRPTARQGQDVLLGSSHIGFRTVRSEPAN